MWLTLYVRMNVGRFVDNTEVTKIMYLKNVSIVFMHYNYKHKMLKVIKT